MFRIAFRSDTGLSRRRKASIARGDLTLGTFSEDFESSLSYWSPTDYQRQWIIAATRLADGESTSAFITSLDDPSHANFIVWWPAWRIGGSVALQNQLLFFDTLTGAFDASDPYAHVRTRKTVSQDGALISEWVVDSEDIRTWVRAQLAV
jgi:hypothetical protein